MSIDIKCDECRSALSSGDCSICAGCYDTQVRENEILNEEIENLKKMFEDREVFISELKEKISAIELEDETQEGV